MFAADDIVRLLYANGARSDSYDDLGRYSAQLASLRTLDHAAVFFETPPLFKAVDLFGRNALHYAVGSGHLDLVEKVFELCGQNANVRDHDGWTPLMWATRLSRRGFGGDENGTELEAIVRFLLSKDADIWVRGCGRGGKLEGPNTWSPLKVARYHGCSDTILQLLTPRACTGDGCDNAAAGLDSLRCQHHAFATEDASDVDPSSSSGSVGMVNPVRPLSDWNESFDATKQGRRRMDTFCNGCLYVSV